MRETIARLIMKLTDITLRALQAPATGVTVYFDDTLTGFGVRVSQAGTKSFVLTHGTRRQRETLGRVGIVSLQEARAEAKRRLALHAREGQTARRRLGHRQDGISRRGRFQLQGAHP
jgi:Arm domain-containing DNA-binding protein